MGDRFRYRCAECGAAGRVGDDEAAALRLWNNDMHIYRRARGMALDRRPAKGLYVVSDEDCERVAFYMDHDPRIGEECHSVVLSPEHAAQEFTERHPRAFDNNSGLFHVDAFVLCPDGSRWRIRVRINHYVQFVVSGMPEREES